MANYKYWHENNSAERTLKDNSKDFLKYHYYKRHLIYFYFKKIKLHFVFYFSFFICKLQLHFKTRVFCCRIKVDVKKFG